jgi:hypothetical protein
MNKILNQLTQINDMVVDAIDKRLPVTVIVAREDMLQSARINQPVTEASARTLLLLAEDLLGQASLVGNEFACLQARQRVRTALKMLGAEINEEE